jgi:hypothetical protein
MKAIGIIRLTLLQAASLGGGVVAAAMALALMFSNTQAARALAQLLPLPEVHWRSAETALIASASPTDMARALAEADAEVAAAPNRLQPYLQRAFIETRAANGVLTPAALADFAHTYDLSPIDYSVAPWREGFAYDHWRALTTPLRIAVMREHVLIWNDREPDFAALGAGIHDSAGRLAYRLTQQRANADFWAKRRKAQTR